MWANALRDYPRCFTVAERVASVTEGHVNRHSDRGRDCSRRPEFHKAEGRACRAGMRAPARVVQAWPLLGRSLDPVCQALRSVRSSRPDAADLWLYCGREAVCSPPSTELADARRRAVALALDVDPFRVESHHPPSPWRPFLVARAAEASQDPDAPLARWLTEGAPGGRARGIQPSGLFPLQDEDEGRLTLSELEAPGRREANHPSFGDARASYGARREERPGARRGWLRPLIPGANPRLRQPWDAPSPPRHSERLPQRGPTGA